MKVDLHYTPPNNHGCSGFWLEVQVKTHRTGVITAGRSCSSSWNYGHDDAAPVLPVGTRVSLPRDCPSWTIAAEDDPGFVDTEGVSYCGASRVAPFDLVT